MKSFVSTSLEDTAQFAKDFLVGLEPKADGATVVGLYGNLGAGKTTLTQAIGKELGIQEDMTSPTFVIQKNYPIQFKSFTQLVHIDAYRLESGRELQTLNFEQLVENPENLIIIEWPENVKEILPEHHLKIECEFIDETTRKFSL